MRGCELAPKMREQSTLPSYIYLLDFAAVIKTKTHAFNHLAKTYMSRVPRIPSPAHISLDNERTRISEGGTEEGKKECCSIVPLTAMKDEHANELPNERGTNGRRHLL